MCGEEYRDGEVRFLDITEAHGYGKVAVLTRHKQPSGSGRVNADGPFEVVVMMYLTEGRGIQTTGHS
jgi:hypothetical protein